MSLTSFNSVFNSASLTLSFDAIASSNSVLISVLLASAAKASCTLPTLPGALSAKEIKAPISDITESSFSTLVVALSLNTLASTIFNNSSLLAITSLLGLAIILVLRASKSFWLLASPILVSANLRTFSGSLTASFLVVVGVSLTNPAATSF